MKCSLIILACVTIVGFHYVSDAPASESQETGGRNKVAPRTEQRTSKIKAGFAKIEQDYGRLKAEIDDMIRVRLDLTPELLLPGEQVALTIAIQGAKRPNPVLEVMEDCYGKRPLAHTFKLAWEKDPKSNGFLAVWRWRPPRCGNYLIHWVCDIGGDIPEFFRNFSVIDSAYAVMILNSTSHRNPRPEPDFHELHLPFSYWAEGMLFGSRPTAESFARFSRWPRQFGDDPGLMIFLGGAYVPGDKRVFYDESEGVQKTVLECYQRLWPMHGFPGPLKSLYTYGMGNGPARVARSLGYDLLGALCADQNWGDGPFKINHWGMPARPYFVSKEDFRKPGDGGSHGVIGVQQCERQTVLCRDHHCVYSFEAGISYAFDQYAGITRPRKVDDVLLSREMDFLQCFVECAGQSSAPYFFSCGFEMNGVWPEMAVVNRHFMEYLVRRAADTRIAYTTATAAGDFLRRHYMQTPETILYLPDVFAGLTHGGKPVNYPDTMEIENHQFKAIFRRGETLPYAQYEYTVRWDYPDWGNADIPRKADGYVVPDTDDRFRITPRIIDTRAFKVSTRMNEGNDGTRMDVEISAQAAQSNLALAVWDLPREYSKDAAKLKLTGAKRFLPVLAPYTHNFCGILVADIRNGTNHISLNVTTSPRSPRSLDLKLGGDVMAKVFERDGSATAYLYCAGGSAQEVRLTVPEGVTVGLYPHDSDQMVELMGKVSIRVEPGKCQKLTGLTYDQLRKCGGDR